MHTRGSSTAAHITVAVRGCNGTLYEIVTTDCEKKLAFKIRDSSNIQHWTLYSKPASVKPWDEHEAMQLSTVSVWLSGSSVCKMRPWALSLDISCFEQGSAHHAYVGGTYTQQALYAHPV